MIKLLASDFDEEDGTSFVTISTDIGNFCGYSFTHPDDINIQSRFFGCEIAEYRAYIYYYTEKIHRLNFELNALYAVRKDYREIVGIKVANIKILPNEPICSILNKRIKQKEEYRDKLKNEVLFLKLRIKSRIETYEKEVKKIREREQEK